MGERPDVELILRAGFDPDRMYVTTVEEGRVVVAFKTPPDAAEIQRLFPVSTKGGGFLSPRGQGSGTTPDGVHFVYSAEQIAHIRQNAREFMVTNMARLSRRHPDMASAHQTLAMTTPAKRRDRKAIFAIWDEFG